MSRKWSVVTSEWRTGKRPKDEAVVAGDVASDPLNQGETGWN